jgi:trehalose 6-phosphate phosphatase
MPTTDEQQRERLLEPLRSAPDRAAVLCDLDGTLAPIVERAEQAAVPAAAREALRGLAARYRLTAVITGRRAAEARQLLGIDGLTYCGNHGFELLLPGAAEPTPLAALGGHERDAARFAAGQDQRALAQAGLRVEDKGPIVALHWRGAAEEDRAETLADELGETAEAQGLLSHRGRKVVEIRPPVAIDKGVAVRSLLSDQGLRAALYGGDDRTDLDAFAALRELEREGALEAACCVAVASAEAPPELTPRADLVVTGPEGFLRVLKLLTS